MVKYLVCEEDLFHFRRLLEAMAAYCAENNCYIQYYKDTYTTMDFDKAIHKLTNILSGTFVKVEEYKDDPTGFIV